MACLLAFRTVTSARKVRDSCFPHKGHFILQITVQPFRAFYHHQQKHDGQSFLRDSTLAVDSSLWIFIICHHCWPLVGPAGSDCIRSRPAEKALCLWKTGSGWARRSSLGREFYNWGWGWGWEGLLPGHLTSRTQHMGGAITAHPKNIIYMAAFLG